MKFIDFVIVFLVASIMGFIVWKKFFSKTKKHHCKTCPYSDCKNKCEYVENIKK